MRDKMEEDEFWCLWEDKKDFLYKLCFKYTGNVHDAQDLLSEVMIKACKKVNEQILNDNAEGWLVRLVKNTYIDHYRHAYKRSIRISYDCNGNRPENSEESPNTPIDEVFVKEIWQYIEKALEAIPPRRRHFTRLYFSGYSYKDICTGYGVTTEALRQMISLSRQELRNHLDIYYTGRALEKNKGDRLYSHVFKHRQNNQIHYYNFVSPVSPNRLKQKEAKLLKYIARHPQSDDRKFKLAVNLSSQGKINRSLKILREILRSNYISEEVYDLQIKLLSLLNRNQEIVKSTENAVGLFPESSCKFYAWRALANNQLDQAEKTLKTNIRKDSLDISLNLQLIKIYELRGKNIEAYSESEKVQYYYPWHPEIYACSLGNKLLFEGYTQAHMFAEDYYGHHPTSATACLNYLHFLVSSGYQMSDSELLPLFTNMRKKYFWHPDYTLIKALLTSNKKSKILMRRCADYPDCALSKHYLRHFTGSKISCPPLTSDERRHLSLIKLIHKDIIKIT